MAAMEPDVRPSLSAEKALCSWLLVPLIELAELLARERFGEGQICADSDHFALALTAENILHELPHWTAKRPTGRTIEEHVNAPG